MVCNELTDWLLARHTKRIEESSGSTERKENIYEESLEKIEENNK